MMKYLLLSFLIFTVSCPATVVDQNSVDYKFFVAGHVYGFPGEADTNIGVHPPFKKKLNMLRDDPDIAFGIFTGDIVFHGADEKEWDELDRDIAIIDKPVYFAPGNHDIGNSKKRAVFTKRYGPSYRSFMHQNDLFIVLDPNPRHWNIGGDQLEWLKDELVAKSGYAKNIFVFFHQLLWWEKDNEFKNYKPNSLSGRAEQINFYSEVLPLFTALEKDVYMFAGDTGVHERGYMYKKKGKITFIASGMGGRKQDNFIKVKVNKDKSVSFELVSLNGEDPNALGQLEDYILP